MIDRQQPSPYVAGLLGRRPHCGEGHLFSGFLTLRPRCEVCGVDYGFADAGDGPAVFVIMIAGFIVCGAALFVEMRYAPPLWVHAVLWLPVFRPPPTAPLGPLEVLLVALQSQQRGAGAPLDGPAA